MLKPHKASFLESYVELFMDVFTNEPFKYSWMRRDNMLRYFTDIQNSPRFVGTASFEGQRLAGFCVGNVNDYFSARSYEIKEIVVARPLQNRGYGSKMLLEIEGYLAENFDVEAITLLTDKKINAYPFYQKNGYGTSESIVYMSKIIPK